MSTTAQKRRYYRDNPEKYRIRARRNYWRNAAAINERKAAWRAEHRDVSVARCAQFRTENPTYFREYRVRLKVRLAWSKWSNTCASNRLAREADHVAAS